ncbi:MAG TPA: hypothetical protein VHO25_15615, partial [Polyangiaceae bacterium]|nr:hypothetical protein [Polyangiaceae bacterium]
ILMAFEQEGVDTGLRHLKLLRATLDAWIAQNLSDIRVSEPMAVSMQRAFAQDMTTAGFDLQPYHGRYFFRGLAVTVNSRAEVGIALSSTSVQLQQDEMGKGWILYPSLGVSEQQLDELIVEYVHFDEDGEDPASPGIQWPQEWDPKEGWPVDLDARAPGSPYTWGELDDVLKKQGSSLAERIGKLEGSPMPANTSGGLQPAIQQDSSTLINAEQRMEALRVHLQEGGYEPHLDGHVLTAYVKAGPCDLCRGLEEEDIDYLPYADAEKQLSRAVETVGTFVIDGSADECTECLNFEVAYQFKISLPAQGRAATPGTDRDRRPGGGRGFP